MKDLKLNKALLGYAMSFVAFAMPKLKDIKEVFLFGSVARKEADEKSDVDLFFNLLSESIDKNNEKNITTVLEEFYKSKIAQIWRLKGITSEFKISAGKLEEWKLKRSIISDGIVLYGRYKETPKNLNAYAYINIMPIKDIAKRNRVIRQLFGRKEGIYKKEGITGIKETARQTSLSFFISLEKTKEVLPFLDKEKVSYKIIEIWTDQIF